MVRVIQVLGASMRISVPMNRSSRGELGCDWVVVDLRFKTLDEILGYGIVNLHDFQMIDDSLLNEIIVLHSVGRYEIAT